MCDHLVTALFEPKGDVVNRFTIAALGVGCALAAIPAHAGVYGATYTSTLGPATSASFLFTTADVLNTRGGYDILAVSGHVNQHAITGFIANPNSPNTYLSAGNRWQIDNVYYTGVQLFDPDGVLFTVDTGAEYNLWGNSPNSYTMGSKIEDINKPGVWIRLGSTDGYMGSIQPPPLPPSPTHPSGAPTVLTFEELLPSTSGPIPWLNIPVLTQGYQIKNVAEVCCTYVTTEVPPVANGEPPLSNQSLSYIDADAVLTAMDGSNFFVTSFDAKSRSTVTTVQSLFVTGLRADGSQVTATFDLTHDFQSFNLTGFDDLVSLTFDRPSNFYWSVDNIAVGPSVVPEPAAWAMLIAGFGVTGVTLRRRRKLALA